MSTLATSAPLLSRPEWRRLQDEHHDLLVVGGGIHGAGVARDAALRGLRVALIERDDWSSGTSSRSSKLFHGGLRYLRQGSVQLVRQSLRERERHLRLAPDLVTRVRFRVPPTPRGTTPLWQIRLGIAVYDLLTGRLRESRFWQRDVSYTDAAFNDARFCLQVVLDARRHGALAIHYVEWLEWIRNRDRIVGARVRDRFTGDEGVVTAGHFVNAAGPWADHLVPSRRRREPLLRLTRGTHVVLDRRADDEARLFFSREDGRAMFLLPYEGGTSLLSTTDLDEAVATPDPVPLEEEIVYLRDAFRSQFPKWDHWRPVGLQCGIRPLLAGRGSPSDLSREERVVLDAGGSLISILGGKYTTYRLVAEKVVDAVLRSAGKKAVEHPTREGGISGAPANDDALTRVRRAFAEEDAVRLADVFLRRTTLGHRGLVDSDLLARAAKLWRLRWGKGEHESEAEVDAFLAQQKRRLAPLSAWDA